MPYELVSGLKPSLLPLQNFIAKSFIYDPLFRKDLTAWEIVGYNIGITLDSKGWAFWKPEKNFITWSVLVKLDELSFYNTLPITTTKKEAGGFLGLCAYVRIFIKDFSQVAAPLRRFTRKDVLLKSDEKCEADFIKLRKIVEE
ncbi:hypothetical protein O181_088422 [Austropuccinia psidii MF-1]|uniref:Uncharacterized protein n=1 Tax=Austropuccinia psidii MF-1 TaxID=1389203 RepID=A0A9Q3P529_9BASI|nr:hypothetical protein [Austropuccinia psidii MF-1]